MFSEHLCSKNICVIGAGPSGLVSARELRKEGHYVTVLEQNNDIGGQWLYQPYVEDEDLMGIKSPLKIHSSVYMSLRLASPRETMGFTDFPFVVKKGRDMRRYPSYDELFLYLQDFCNWFKLREMIRFNTRVEYVGMVESCDFSCDGEIRWVVRSKDIESGIMSEDVFDAVVVANGHYSIPRLPIIKGMDAWRRRQLHSHVYRVPQPFTNEIVVVVGTSMSGQDISMELVNVAKEVHLSAKSLEISKGLSKVITKYENLHLKPQINALYEDGRVAFVDGTIIVADTIIYCTGYSYSLQFLDTKGIVCVDDDRVGPLYEHTFPPSLSPSLSFVGIPKKVIVFPFFESQAKWIAQVLSRRRTLPSFEEMMKAIDEYYHSRDLAGIQKHKAHDIADFEYCDKYGDKCDFPHLEEWRKELCLSSLLNAEENLETYRDCWDDDTQSLQEAVQTTHFTHII